MKIVHPDFSNEIIIDDYLNLIIENKKFYRNILLQLNFDDLFKEGDMVISDGDKIIDYSKNVIFINDLISFDINQRKIIGLLYDELQLICNSNDIVEKRIEVFSNIISFLDLLKQESDYDFEFNIDTDIDALLKAFSVKFEKYVDPYEKIVNLIDIISKSKSIKLLVTSNLNTLFNDEELSSIIKECSVKDLKLLNVTFIDNMGLEYKKTVIDNDLCLI